MLTITLQKKIISQLSWRDHRLSRCRCGWHHWLPFLHWLKRMGTSHQWSHSRQLREAVEEARESQRCSMMKCVFALVVLWHLCYSTKSLNMTLNKEMIDRLEILNKLYKGNKVNISSVSIMHWYYHTLFNCSIQRLCHYVSVVKYFTLSDC